ncbi:MAG: ABC transporter ATP-binding protein [Desulfobacteraceae bacterium]|nr:MAG: ABC transporter ATP-binding protein [Desulfobacteraceae bacterium]
MLEVRDSHAYIGQTYVLKGVSLEVRHREIVALIGANGAGKTTTLSTISGLTRSRRGKILFRPDPDATQRDITRVPAEEIVSMGISHCPEGRQVFSDLNVWENLLIGAYLRKDKQAIQSDLQWVCELFPILGDRRRQSAGSLSGGEQMMLVIGRALMSRPRLLLLDEPSLGLAPILVEVIFEMLEQINAQGTTILLVEQNARMALELAQRAYVMETGRVTLSGTGRELAENEEVRKAYLGAT